MTVTTLRLLLNDLIPLFLSSKVENPIRELRLICAHVLDIPYEDLIFRDDLPIDITPKLMEKIQSTIQLRLQGMPLAKIIGKKEFWGLDFKVTQDTLDPRPESETLIEAILDRYPDRSTPLKLLDLGTGSGCLLISLLYEYPNAQGVGVDLSQMALEIAYYNAINLKVDNRCTFLQSNWFEKVEGRFNIILSNPPYIAPNTPLDPETLHDPESALFAPEEGYLHYRLILEEAKPFLAPEGVLVFEIGANQEAQITQLATKNGYRLVESKKDLLGHTRCLIFLKS